MTASSPDLGIEIVNDNRLTDIVAQRFDIGIRSGAELARHMIAVRIGPDFRFAIAATPSYLTRHGVPSSPQDLARHNCINLRTATHDAVLPWGLVHDGRQIEARVAGQWVFGSTYDKLAAALSGQGLVHLPEDLARPHVEAGQLRWVMEDWWPTVAGMHAYYPNRRQSSRALRVVIDALRWQPEPTQDGSPRA